MFEISQTWFAAWTGVRINYSRKSESASFSHKSCSYFIGCGFAYPAKSWIQLRTNMYITIFVFSSPSSCFKSTICIQNSLESAPIALFSSRLKEGKIIHKKSLRTPFTLIFHSEATLTSINVIPFHFKCQRSNLSVLGTMKTRPWKFVDLAHNAPWLPALFERVILIQKTVFNCTGWPRFQKL